MPVAAAIRTAMIHSSSRSRMRSSTGQPYRLPRVRGRVREGVNITVRTGGGKCPSSALPASGEAVALPRSGLRHHEAGGLIDLVDEILAEAAPHFLVDRHQLGDPGLLPLIGEVVNLDPAGGLDLLECLR